MVGIGWKCPNENEWNYECLYVNQINMNEEKRIIEEFNTKIKNLEDKYNTRAKVMHWSHAEKTFYNNVKYDFKLIYIINI